MEKLKFRHELKFHLCYGEYLTIRNRIKPVMQNDENSDEKGEYHIKSLYFDDYKNTALYEKLAGMQNRHKYRIRIYNNDSSVINLEKKMKRDSYIAKEKQKLTLDEYNRLISNDCFQLAMIKKPLLRELCIEMQINLLKPKVIVEYIREAYVSPLGNTRITFDKELRTGLRCTDLFSPGMATIRSFDDSTVIMEVKFDEYLPTHIRDMLLLGNLTKQSASKYVICGKHSKNNLWEDH